jgi:hypothetical protein
MILSVVGVPPKVLEIILINSLSLSSAVQETHPSLSPNVPNLTPSHSSQPSSSFSPSSALSSAAPQTLPNLTPSHLTLTPSHSCYGNYGCYEVLSMVIVDDKQGTL